MEVLQIGSSLTNVCHVTAGYHFVLTHSFIAFAERTNDEDHPFEKSIVSGAAHLHL